MVDENGSYVPALSEKRDAVGTEIIVPTGKIAKVSVIAEYRDSGCGFSDL